MVTMTNRVLSVRKYLTPSFEGDRLSVLTLNHKQAYNVIIDKLVNKEIITMTATTYAMDMHFQKMNKAEDILNTLYTETSTAIDQYGLINGFCNMFLKIGKQQVFVEVQVDALTADVKYFVASSKNTANRIPALGYTQAIRELRQLLG